MTESGENALYDSLQKNAEGAKEKAAEHNIYSAAEEFYVGYKLCQMALQTAVPDLTPERVEATSRIAWAQSELQLGNATRVRDDLEGIESLAEQIR